MAERCAAVGGVRQSLVDALKAVLEDSRIDGGSAAAIITPPASAELQALISNADPVILHEVRCAPGAIASGGVGGRFHDAPLRRSQWRAFCVSLLMHLLYYLSHTLT